jgi:hypothetical protein
MEKDWKDPFNKKSSIFSEAEVLFANQQLGKPALHDPVIISRLSLDTSHVRCSAHISAIVFPLSP